MDLNELFKQEIKVLDSKNPDKKSDRVGSKEEMTKSELKERERKLALLEEIIKEKGNLEVVKQEAGRLVHKAKNAVELISDGEKIRIVCPTCKTVYEKGRWINSKSEVYIESEKIGKRSCPRCEKTFDWDKIETSGSWWWAGERKDCPDCKEKAFIRTAKGWLARTDEVIKAEEDRWYGFDLEDLIERYEEEQRKKNPDKKAEKKDEDEVDWLW